VVGKTDKIAATMKKPQLKVGIIGLGLFFNKRHWPALHALKKLYTIQAVYSSSPKKFSAFLSKCPSAQHVTNMEELLKQDIDLVIACLPISIMFDVAQKVLKAKKHLVLSKPFTKDSRQAKQLLSLARQNKVKLFVTENFRFLSSIHKIKHLLDRNSLGPVRMIKVHSINSFDLSSPYAMKGNGWRINPKNYYGILLDGGIHMISTLRFLFSKVKLKYRHLCSHNPYLGKYDTAHFHLLLDNIDTFMTITYAVKQQDYYFLKIFCQNGVYHVSKEEIIVEKNYKIQKTYTFSDDEYIAIYKSIHKDLVDNVPMSFSAQDAYKDILMFEKLFMDRNM
jgi:predicted dehydrogenase